MPTICPMCESDIEHLLHIFFDCKFALDCWQVVGLSFNMQLVEWAPGWLMDRISNEDEGQVIKIAEVLWCIWFTRNKKIWEGQNIPSKIAMEISAKMVRDWQARIERKTAAQIQPVQYREYNNTK